MRLVLFAACVVGTTPATADTAADLARVKQAFDLAREFPAEQVNRLQPAVRRAIWFDYYRALELIGRLEVHHQMITRHKVDRHDRFAADAAEFDRVLESLNHRLHENL